MGKCLSKKSKEHTDKTRSTILDRSLKGDPEFNSLKEGPDILIHHCSSDSLAHANNDHTKCLEDKGAVDVKGIALEVLYSDNPNIPAHDSSPTKSENPENLITEKKHRIKVQTVKEVVEIIRTTNDYLDKILFSKTSATLTKEKEGNLKSKDNQDEKRRNRLLRFSKLKEKRTQGAYFVEENDEKVKA